MKDINEIIGASGAPFNREERFFTGTVLSLLFSGNDFKNLKVITDIMAPKLNLEPIYPIIDKNILFYTEYNLKKSGKVSEDEESSDGDTPDVLFYIFDNGNTYLFAIEVKMFHRPTNEKLKQQIEGQLVILKSLADRKNIPHHHIFHTALLPKKLAQQLSGSFITWEDILEKYTNIKANNYALDMLGYALEHYDQLVSKQSSSKKNNTGEFRGSRIVSDHLHLQVKFVGCGHGGLHGNRFKQLVKSGDWKNAKFQVTTSEIRPEHENWFSIEDFLKAVN